MQVGNKRLKVQHKQIRDHDVAQGYDGYAGGHIMTAPPSGTDETAWYGQAPDGTGATSVEGSGEGNADDDCEGASEPVEEGTDPLSGLDPLRQALPETGVTEST